MIYVAPSDTLHSQGNCCDLKVAQRDASTLRLNVDEGFSSVSWPEFLGIKKKEEEEENWGRWGFTLIVVSEKVLDPIIYSMPPTPMLPT